MISRDNGSGLSSEGTRQDRIIVRISKHGRGDVSGNDQVGESRITEDQSPRGYLGECQPFCELGAVEDFRQLGQERKAREEIDPPLSGSIQDQPGSPEPE